MVLEVIFFVIYEIVFVLASFIFIAHKQIKKMRYKKGEKTHETGKNNKARHGG